MQSVSQGACANQKVTPCNGVLQGVNGPRSGLDLIFGHLTISTPLYQPVHRNSEVNEWPENWYRPSGDWSSSESGNLVLTIQPFHAGGYEATIRPINLPEMARMIDAPRKQGERERPDELDPENQARSIQRSKKQARIKIKSMGADRLLTLTKRETEQGGFWTLDDWRQAWERFCKAMKKAGHAFDYVAVPERHKKGNFHLHVALNARCNINLMRQIWWACCGGRGMGNVDIAYKKHLTPTQRLAGIARYLTKYLVKQFGQTEFNKKRYWASRHQQPHAVRVVLRATVLNDALQEMASLLQLDLMRVVNTKHVMFTYPRGEPTGLWLNWCPEVQASPF